MYGLASHLGEDADVQANTPDAAAPALTPAPTIAQSPTSPLVVIGIVAAITYFVLSATLRSGSEHPQE